MVYIHWSSRFIFTKWLEELLQEKNSHEEPELFDLNHLS